MWEKDPLEERARKYREAVAPYLGGQELEAAGIFRRPGAWLQGGGLDPEHLLASVLAVFERVLRVFGRAEEKLRMGRLSKLPESFLLAVTWEKVYVFSYEGASGILIQAEIAAFDRDEIRIRSMAGGEVLSLETTEQGRTRSIELDGEVVSVYPGAAEVIAALSTARST
jgi:hypothetical protein